jgi:hypothetical protein
MRIAKLIGALFVVLAFSAVAVATASAAETLWKWLPGTVGETFTGKSGQATLQLAEAEPKVKPAITCKKSLLLLPKSELLAEGATGGKDATLALGILHFEGCTSFGLPANSEGDTSGIILVHLEIHNCMIKKEPKEFGLLITPLPLHIEIPASGGKLILVRGAFVAKLEGKEGTKQLIFSLIVEQKEAKQAIKLCEGGPENTLEGSLDGKTFVIAGEEAKEGTLGFDMTLDKEGEEPMEK